MGNTVEAIYKIKAVLDVSDIKSNSKVIQDSLKNVGLPANMSSNFARIFKELEQETDNFKSKLEGSFNTKGDISGLEKSGQRISKLYDEISSEIEKILGKNLSKIKLVDTKEIQLAKNALAELLSKLTSKVEAGGLKEVETAIQKISTVSKNQNIDAFFKAFKSGDILAAKTHLEALSNSAKNFTNLANLTVFNDLVSVMKDKLSLLSSVDGLDEVKKDIGDVRNNLTNLLTAEVEKFAASLARVKGQSDLASNGVNEFKNKTVEAATSQKQLNDEVELVKSRVKYFFSLANGVYLFKRAVREAYETVKELDAAMTETAVVTDFSVGDMWDKLPEYSALAKELGATILGAYETMTLFYQLGLDTNEAFALGTETMKMARIAGLDYANATDLMTAALRGFNMELNEASAQRVNDVYSELAAITASDTEEIANAMTKTASIANSANMEFETTAAFLSLMIETTREPAENLGTAMKTIIARFTEMKNAPSDIFEVEGEEVNVNKVDAALASVGVSLKNAKGEFRDLDDVFLDLAEKWDSLDIMSQRYIATTAAGSRLQSRFIAMMSNYERTLELVEAAQNSTGASLQQFEKTQESLEAKLNRLKDAWDQFTMGIANSSFIKGAVDLLTKLLETINKLTDSSNGFVNSISKIALAFGVFKGASALFNKAMDGIGNSLANSMKKAGVIGGQELGNTVVNNASNAIKAKGAGLASAFSNIFAKSKISTEAFDMVGVFKKNEAAVASYGVALKNGFGAGQAEALAVSLAFNLVLNATGLTSTQMISLTRAYLSGATTLGAYTFALTGNEMALQDGLDETTAAILIEAKLADERGDTARATELAALAEQNLLKSRGKGAVSGLASKIGNASTKIGELTKKIKTANVSTIGFSGVLKILGNSVKSSFAELGTALKGLLSSIGSLVSALAPLLAGIAIVALIIGGFVLSYKAIDAAAHKYQKLLEETTEALKKATEAALNAKEAYDLLHLSLEKYDTASNALNILEKNTADWNKKLLESNEIVLDLLRQYPELADYVDNINGKLTIREGGYDFLELEGQQVIRNTTAGENIASYLTLLAGLKVTQGNIGDKLAKKSSHAFSMRTAEFLDLFSIPTSSSDNPLNLLGPLQDDNNIPEVEKTRLALEQLLETISEAYKENPKIFSDKNSDDFKDLAYSVGMTTDKLYDMRDEIEDYLKAENDVLKNTEILIDSILSASASAELLGDELSTEFIKAAEGAVLPELFTAKVEEKKGKLKGKDLLNRLTEEGLIDTGDELKNLQNLYHKLTGLSIEEIELSFGENSDDLRLAIAQIDVGKELGDKLNQFYQDYGKNTGARELVDAISKTGTELAMGNYKFGSVKDLAESMGLTEDEFNKYATELGYESGKALHDSMQEKVNDVKVHIGDIKDVDELKGKLKDFSKEEYDVAIKLVEDGESFDNFEDFSKRVLTTVLLQKVKIALQNVEGLDFGIEALTSSQSLSGLDESLLAAFLNALSNTKDIYNENLTAAQAWTAKSNEGILELISYLNDLKAANLGIGDSKVALENFSNFKMAEGIGLQVSLLLEERDQILLILDSEEDLTDEEFNEALKSIGYDKVKDAENAIDELNNKIESYGWDIDIKVPGLDEVMDYLDGMVSEILAVQNVASKIGKGFTTSIGEVDALALAIPGILDGAKVTADGTVQLNKEVVQDTIASKKAEMEADHEKVINELNGRIKETKAARDAEQIKLNLAAAAYNSNEEMDSTHIEWLANNSDKLTLYLIDKGVDKGQAEAAVYALMQGDFQTYKDTVGHGYDDINKTVGSAMVASGKTSNDFFTKLGNKAKGVLAGIKAAFATAFKKDGISVKDAFLKAYNSVVGSTTVTLYKATIYNTKTGLFSSDKDYDAAGKISQNKTDLRQDIIKYLTNLDKYNSQIAALEGEKDRYDLQYQYAMALLTNIGKGLAGNLSGSSGGSKGSSGGSKGSSKDTQKFTDETDKSFNTLQQIEAEKRSRDELKQAYDNLVEDDTATLQDLINNLNKQEASLLRELALDEKLIGERKSQLQGVLNSNKDLQKYAWYDWSTNTVLRNDALVKSLEGQSAEKGTTAYRYKEYFDDLLKAADNYIDATQSLKDTNQDLLDLKKINPEDDFKNARYNNSITWLESVASKLESVMNEQEILEKEYNALLENRNATAADIASSLNRQKENLLKQQSLQEELLRLNKYYMQLLLKQNQEYEKYATYDWQTGTVEINADEIAKIVNQEEGEKVEEFIQKLENFRDGINDAAGTLLDIKANVEKIEKEGQDARLTLEDNVLLAYLKLYEDLIEELEKINDTLNDNNALLIDSMRDSLEKERQERENQEKEKSITDKEARLAYLKRDTTGANQQEILELQKEIDEEKEDYTDTLIDQKINELEEQNDLAAKLREDLISLLLDLLEELEKHPDWNELYKIINTGIGSNGTLVTGSKLLELLEDGAGYDGMSDVEKMAWMDETNTLLKQAVAYEQNVRLLENLTDDERGVKAGQSITFTNAEGKKLTGVYQSNGDVVVTDGNYQYTYHDVYKDFAGNYKQITDNYDKKLIKKDPEPSNTPTSGSGSNTGGGGSNTGGGGNTGGSGGSNTGGGNNTSIVKGSKVKAKANTLIYDSYDDKTGEKQKFSSNPNYVVLDIKNKRAKVRHVSASSGVTGWFNLSELTLVSGGGSSTTTTSSKRVLAGANVKADPSAKIYGNSTTKNGVAQHFKNDPKYKVLKIENNRALLRHHTARSGVTGWIDVSKLTAYKTGGLVDFTGLAWLDGTKNKPETVLNYKDTLNFMDLKDNLKALRTNGVKKPTQTITNNPSFTINVNVDEISNDYDVDRLVDRVKRDILLNSGYRNVTAINFRK